jgi:aryl-alcohol dehydrogenase-like predicted oxidoreductase
LLGGFFSEKYLNVDEPTRADLTTSSLQKYKNMIDIWGGWELFQELLEVLNKISQKHNCSIANIATRFILDKPQVAGVIIGARLGITEHIEDNNRVFSLKLDQDDISLISTVTSKSNDLFDVIGDCGDEYR